MKKRLILAGLLGAAGYLIQASDCVRGSRFGLTVQNGAQSMASRAQVNGNPNPNGWVPSNSPVVNPGTSYVFSPPLQLNFLDYSGWNGEGYQSSAQYVGALNASYVGVQQDTRWAYGVSAGIGCDTSLLRPLVRDRSVVANLLINDVDPAFILGFAQSGNGRLSTLNGSLSLNAKFLLGKAFSWGMPYMQAGFKTRQFQLNVPYAKGILAVEGDLPFDTFSGVGWTASSDAPTYGSKSIRRWAPGVCVAIGCDFDISPSLSLGFSAEYDWYGSVTMNISNLPIASPVNSDGQQLSTGSLCSVTFKPSTMAFMLNMTYAFVTKNDASAWRRM